MAEVREQRQRERVQGRQQRRSRSDVTEGGSTSVLQPELKRALATAATAGLVGALAGAAKAFADRRGSEPEPQHDAESVAHEQEDNVEDEGGMKAPEAEARQPEPDDEDEPAARDSAPERGAESGELAEIIERARQHVTDVTGSAVESVSGIERSNGNWTVSVEVVQMRRVPESTDVLASYAVVLDDDGGLVSLQQIRRYRRSQADEE